MMTSWLLVLISFFIVAFGQPAWVPQAGLIAALCGYALFWKAMLQCSGRLSRFFLSGGWFAAVHAVQLSWMTSTHYMGPFILVVYAGLLVGLGIQFGLLSLCLNPKKKISSFQCFALAGGGVFLEWIRLYFLSGFTWNPTGLALINSFYPFQLAACIGIYGLTFWVFWTNFSALAFFLNPTKRKALIWAALALFPYGYGVAHLAWVNAFCQSEGYFKAAVINTAVKVEEKNRDKQHLHAFIPPITQWERVWSSLRKEERIQLIVLPEAAFPYSTDRPYCPLEIAQAKWKEYFGEEGLKDFPPLEAPFAFLYDWKGSSYWMVSNAFFAKTLANHFQADLITGLDYEGEVRTNAAFLFRPNVEMPERYDKRILVPVGEYVPLQKVQWIADFLARQFGIYDSFETGMEGKVLHAFLPIGVPICLEEMYSSLVRDFRKKGAKLFVSLSNDVWFPGSRLAKQHFDHARVRAVENGVFLIRSSNMGWTGSVDCFGQPLQLHPPEKQGAVYLSMPIFSYSTPYLFWGDMPVLAIGSLSFAIYILLRQIPGALLRRKSCL